MRFQNVYSNWIRLHMETIIIIWKSIEYKVNCLDEFLKCALKYVDVLRIQVTDVQLRVFYRISTNFKVVMNIWWYMLVVVVYC